jgi:hypothetical protein
LKRIASVLPTIIGALLVSCVAAVDFNSFTKGSDAGASSSSGVNGGSSSSSSSSSGATNSDGGGTDGGANPTSFYDDFNRPDGPVGNGWLTNSPNVWRISGNSLDIRGSGLDFQADHLYRPLNPSWRDVTVSVEIVLTGLPPDFPQIHARTTPSSDYPGYLCALTDDADSKTLAWGRQSGNDQFDIYSTVTLNETLQTNVTYRMTFTVTGDNPVHFSAQLARKTMNGTFKPIGSGESDDTNDNRISTAGQVGLSTYNNGNYSYDELHVDPAN